MASPDVFTLDGEWKGKFAGFYQGQDGRVYLVVKKVRIQPGSSRTFKKKKKGTAHRYLDHLYKKAEADPQKLRPFLAMLEDEGYDYLPLDNPKSEILINGEKVMIVQRDKNWLPLPLTALLENSPHARDTLAELYTLYTAYLRFERPHLVRENELLKQLDRANQRLINTLRYENDALIRTVDELSRVVNNAYRMIVDLEHMAEFFRELYTIYKQQAAGWEDAFAKSMESLPLFFKLVDELKKQFSQALNLSMELDISEWTGKQAMLEAIERYRKQLRELEKQAAKAAAGPVSQIAKKVGGELGAQGERSGSPEGSGETKPGGGEEGKGGPET